MPWVTSTVTTTYVQGTAARKAAFQFRASADSDGTVSQNHGLAAIPSVRLMLVGLPIAAAQSLVYIPSITSTSVIVGIPNIASSSLLTFVVLCEEHTLTD